MRVFESVSTFKFAPAAAIVTIDVDCAHLENVKLWIKLAPQTFQHDDGHNQCRERVVDSDPDVLLFLLSFCAD